MFNLEQLLILTPATIALYAMVVLIVLFHLLATGRTMKESYKVQSLLMRIARQYVSQSVTFVIDLRQKADVVFPLLDHLRERNYDKLSIVVRVHSTAGSKARTALENYRRRHHLGARLRVVTHRRGLTDAALIRRYAVGDIIVPLEAHHRLPRIFFRYLSYAFIDENVTALQFRRYRRPRNSLLSAFRSLDQQWASALREAIPPTGRRRKGFTSGVAVRRDAIAENTPYTPRYLLSDRFGLDETCSELSSVTPVSSLIRAVVLLAIGAVLLSIFAVTSPATAQFLGGLMLGLLAISAVLLVTSPRGLGIGDKIALALILPFYPLYILLDALAVMMTLIISGIVVGLRRLSLTTRKA